MSNVIGHATLNVVPSTKGFSKALNSELGPVGASGGKSLGGKVGGAFKGVVGPLMAAAGVVGMGMFVSGAIKKAGALEQSMGAIGSVFKGSATEMRAWATSAASDVGLSANAYNELGTLIGSQLKNAGVAMDDLGPKTNNLIGLGADLASMFGGTSKEAVEAISSALKGERDPIEKYGVSLKQAGIDAKAAELGFSKVNGALSAEANAAATLALIMEQTTDAHGNFAKESTTYEGVMQRLGASWENVTTTIGQAFLPFATAAGSVMLAMMPTVQGLADGFSRFGDTMQFAFESAGGGMAGIAAMFETAFSGLGEWISGGGLIGMLEGLANSRESFFNAITAALPGILEALVAFLPTLLTFVTGTLIPQLVGEFIGIVTQLVAVAGTLMPQIVEALASTAAQTQAASAAVFVQIVDALVATQPLLIAALVGILPKLVTTLVGMVPGLIQAAITLFKALVDAIPQIIPPLIEGIVGLLPEIVSAVVELVPELIQGAVTLFTALVQSLPIILPVLLDAIVNLIPAVIVALVNMIPVLIEGAVTLFTALIDALPVILPELLSTAADIVPKIAKALIDLIPQLFDAGVNIVQGLMDGIASLAGSIGNFFLNLLPGWIVEPFKAALGIHSPSKVFEGFGKNIGQGLINGLTGSSGDVKSATEKLAQQVTDAFAKITDERSKAADKVTELNAKVARSREKSADIARRLDAAEDKADDLRARRSKAKTKDERKRLDRQIKAQDATVDKLKKQAKAEVTNRRKLNTQIAEQKKLVAESDKALKSGNKNAVLKAIQQADKQLSNLADAREKIAEKLAEARDRLEDAIALRDDFAKGIKDGILGAFNVSAYNTAPGMLDNIRDVVSRTKEFTGILAQLRAAGLNDASYKQLVEGFAANGDLTAAQGLLAGGKGAIKELNGLQTELTTLADALGTTAASSLYQAGVDAAQGLVKGLEGQESKLTGLMERIAESLVDTVKKKLGIKSPSRVFASLGVFVGQGLVRGLDAMGDDIEDASGALAARTIAGYEARPALPSVPTSTAPGDSGDGPTFVTNYYDHSTSQEDKSAKLNRAQDNLKASVAANLRR